MSSLVNDAGWISYSQGSDGLVCSSNEIRFQPQRHRIAALIRFDVNCRFDFRAHSAAAARAASDPLCTAPTQSSTPTGKPGSGRTVGGDLRQQPITDPNAPWAEPPSLVTSQSLIPKHRGRDLPLSSTANTWWVDNGAMGVFRVYL